MYKGMLNDEFDSRTVRQVRIPLSENQQMAKVKTGRHGLHRLTVTEVRALAPGWTCDGGGLYAFVASPGTGSWVFRYAGKNMGLGSIAVVNLAEARERARKCRELRAAGLDPHAHRDAERTAIQVEAAKAFTFDQAAERYLAAHAPAWRNPKHRQQWTNTMATYASPVIGALPVGAIDVGLVLQILEPIWSVKPETAGRVRGRIEVILDWAKARGYRAGENPARWKGLLDKLLPKRSKIRRVKHHPALPYIELPAFMAALQERPGVAARALEFAILTASRSGEVRGMTFGEVDFSTKVWIVPAERMKAGRPHRVPLGPRALEIAAEMMATTNKIVRGDITTLPVFPGARGSLSDMSLTAVLRRMGRTDVVPHGFRATFKTWAAERTNFPREVVEAALAHVAGDKVEAAYQRGDIFDKRRRLMAAWDGFANRTACDVVPIRGAS
jgi:integrase